ncbi:MAG TPA: ATP-binding cassette domain-containing protein, partial [Thermoanaerobaculia bacterium]|nr:ATP-binding cassette domain-containing protein [Thermoanaerobaculia bacterium]
MTASQERPTSVGSVGSVELVVAVQGMTRRYDKIVAAEDVTFEVRRGEMFGLIGPDGAGKTTTLRVVLGLLA